MTDTATHPLAQVAELDEERRRYEGWLAQLEARRDASPEHVYTRVRADYQGRLQAVLARLAEHAETLRHVVDQLAGRVADLRSAERQRQDERAEAELRTVVGEYTPDQWAEIQAVSDEELAALAQERQGAEQELAQLQELLARAAGPGAAPAPVAAPQADSRRGVTPAGGAAAVGGAVPLGEVPVVPATPTVPLDLVQPAPAAPPARSTTPSRHLGAVQREPDAADWSRGLDDRSATGGGRAPTPSDPASALSDDGGPQIKTLKCQECGTMNYPTEWYCERGGGELATL